MHPALLHGKGSFLSSVRETKGVGWDELYGPKKRDESNRPERRGLLRPPILPMDLALPELARVGVDFLNLGTLSNATALIVRCPNSTSTNEVYGGSSSVELAVVKDLWKESSPHSLKEIEIRKGGRGVFSAKLKGDKEI